MYTNNLTENAISRGAQLTRFINAPIALRYGIQDQVVLLPSL